MAEQEGAEDRGELEVLPENVNAVRLFMICQTQWRCHASGLLGLDYPAVRLCADTHAIPFDADTLTRVQVIEGEILRGDPDD